AVAGDDFRARAQGVVAEATHRAGTTGGEVLEERQAGGGDGLAVVRRIREARAGRRVARHPGVGLAVAVGVDQARRGVAAVADVVAAVAVAVAPVQAGAQREGRAELPVARELVVDLVVLGGRTRQGRLQAQALVGAARRHEEVVAGVARPAQFGAPGVEGALADRVEVVDDRLRGVAGPGLDLVAVDAEQQRDRAVLGDRQAEHGLYRGVG